MNKRSGFKRKTIICFCLFLLISVIACELPFSFLNPTEIATAELNHVTNPDESDIQKENIIAMVNSTKITEEDFETRVKYERYTLIQTFISYQTSAFAQYFQSQLLDIQNQLDIYVQFGSDVLDDMITEEVVIQEAEELGILVTKEDIDRTLEENFGFFVNGTPTPVATFEKLPTSTYSPTQLALITLAAPSSELPTEAASTEILPTPTFFSRDAYENLYSTAMANVESQIGFDNEDFRNYIRNTLYAQKLYDYVTKDVSSEQDMVWARHIMVLTEEEAFLVIDKLLSGEDFSNLAAQYSQDTSNNYNGGDLGWFYKSQMVEEFENAAWSLEIGEISQPVKTSFGYLIIQVLGHEPRQMTADELNSAKSTFYQSYINDLLAGATIKKSDTWTSIVPDEPTIPVEFRITIQ